MPGNSDRVEFERTVSVPKRELDPFGGEAQAVGLAKRRADLPRNPNARRLEFEARDNGDHYEVTVRGVSDAAIPSPGGRGDGHPGRGKAKGRGGGHPGRGEARGRRRGGRRGPGLGFGTGALGLEGGDGYDLEGHLRSRLTVAELREIRSRHGLTFGSNARKRDMVRALVDQAPGLARELAGR